MKKPFTFLHPPEMQTELIDFETCPFNRKYEMQFGESYLSVSQELELLRQYYSGNVIYLELLSSRIIEPVSAEIVVNEPYLAFVFVMDGKMNRPHPNGKEDLVMSAGSCFVEYVPEGKGEYLLTPGESVVALFVIRQDWLEKKNDDYPLLSELIKSLRDKEQAFEFLGPCKINEVIKRQLTSLIGYKGNDKTTVELKMLEGAYRLIIAFINQLSDPKPVVWQSNRQIADAVEVYIELEFFKNPLLRVDTIANHFNMETKRLGRICQEAFKLSLNGMIVSVKMKTAKHLLQKDRISVKNVAFRLGYSDVSSFTRAYSKHHNVTPAKAQQYIGLGD